MEEKTNNEIFASNLRYYINEKGYKQIDLARHVNVSSGTLADWCAGRYYPRMDKIEILADFLGIEKSDLLEERTEKRTNEKKAMEIAKDISENPENLKLYCSIKNLAPQDKAIVTSLVKSLEDKNK